jgi:hypothetical protein
VSIGTNTLSAVIRGEAVSVRGRQRPIEDVMEEIKRRDSVGPQSVLVAQVVITDAV